MTVYYDEDEMRSRLSGLDHKCLVLFGLFVAERLLPNYSLFSKEQSWGDVGTLRTALDIVWSWLETEQADEAEIESMIEHCKPLGPDTDEFESLYLSAALDAAVATINVLRLVLDGDSELAVENGSFGRDTVDMYVQVIERMPTNSSDREEQIRLHPLMQREICSQFDAIQMIESGITVGEAKHQWRSSKRSNLEG